MKQIAVLGLSRFGASVARALTNMGVEVMGVDKNPDKVADLAHDITHAVQADILDDDALDFLGLRNFDVVVLSIKDVEISCIATMALKDHGAVKIVAQAGGEAHGKILERIGADKVIMPEKDMGIRLARSLSSNNLIDYMELSAKALIKKEFDKAFEKYDIILGPAAPTTAPKLGESLSDPIKMYLGDIYTISVNLAGLPGICVPCGSDKNGLPIGVQLIGDCFSEKTLIRAAYTYEQHEKNI